MDDKDLENLKRWEFEQKQNDIAKYGIDLSKINIDKSHKKIIRLSAILKRLGYLLKKITFLLFFVVGIIILFNIYMNYKDLEARFNINIKEELQGQYNIKIKFIEIIPDGNNGNGKYYIQSKTEPKIKFTAIKKNGRLTQDYSERMLKYYFDLWNSTSKRYFTVDESINNDILSYYVYIDNFNNIEDAASKLIEFAKFCGDDFKGYWNIYIKVNDARIFPYSDSITTHEQAMENAKRLYNSYKN